MKKSAMLITALMLGVLPGGCTRKSAPPPAQDSMPVQPPARDSMPASPPARNSQPEQPTAARPKQPRSQMLLGTWDLETMDGVSPVGARITATFTSHLRGAKLSGSSGCNSYFAGVTYGRGPGAITIGDVVSSTKACIGEGETAMVVMKQEERYLRLLDRVQAFAVTGNTLRLSTADGKHLDYSKRPVPRNQPLAGTVWTLNSVITGGMAASPVAGMTVTMVIRNGTVSLDTSCNRITASIDPARKPVDC